MRVLLVGSGGREDALAWALCRSPRLELLRCAPGNAGMARRGECIDIGAGDVDSLCAHAADERYDLVVVGPEAPLVAGLADRAAVADQVLALSAGRPHIWLVTDPAASPITAHHLRQSVESVAASVSSQTVGGATITEYAVAEGKAPSLESPVSSFGHQISLIDALLPDEPVTDRFTTFLRWQTDRPTTTDLHTILYLRDAADRTWAEGEQPLLNDNVFPTTAWAPGEWPDVAMTIRLPAFSATASSN